MTLFFFSCAKSHLYARFGRIWLFKRLFFADLSGTNILVVDIKGIRLDLPLPGCNGHNLDDMTCLVWESQLTDWTPRILGVGDVFLDRSKGYGCCGKKWGRFGAICKSHALRIFGMSWDIKTY